MFGRTPEPDGSEAAPFGQLAESDVLNEVDYLERLLSSVVPDEVRISYREQYAGVASNEALQPADKVRQLSELYWKLVRKYHPEFQSNRARAFGAAMARFTDRLPRFPIRVKGMGPYINPDSTTHRHPSMPESQERQRPYEQDEE